MNETPAAGLDPSLAPRARALFAGRFGGPPDGCAVAPGRVNLIGEHTDYNDGFVLPLAIGRATVAAFRPRNDGRLRAVAAAYDEVREAAIADLRAPGGREWFDYVCGVAWALREDGLDGGGADLAVVGDVPIGAGLSSSASLELAVMRALAAVRGTPWDAVRMARLGQRAENAYVGVASGIMDQFASGVSREGAALLLDCRSLETRDVPVPAEAAVVVMDTGARRSLGSSAYNDRRAACERVVAAVRELSPAVRALRDVDEGLLERVRDRVDPVDFRRAQHVVAENRRPPATAEALQAGDLAGAGRLMAASHASLRDLYEVSSAELDLVVELASGHAACYGARMTGAGFGGCAVALVQAAGADAFCAAVLDAYRSRVELPAALYPCRPVAGARLLD